MAVTINAEYARWVSNDVVGGSVKQFAIYELLMDSVYVDGGEIVDFTSLAPFSAVDAVLLLGWDSGSATVGYVVEYDKAVGGIRVFDCGADGDPLDEVGAIDLSAMTVNVLVIGDE